MPWLADTDVGAAYGLARSIVGARTEVELRGRALEALDELVPADVLTWDRVELATGAVDHEATPVGAEPAGAFEAVVGHAGHHPLAVAHPQPIGGCGQARALMRERRQLQLATVGLHRDRRV